MSDTFVSSDRNTWLRPYWRRLHQQQSFFANLAPELQANALADAVAEDHPNKAVEIRAWTPTQRRAMIAVLDQALREKHAEKQTELWRMTKGNREVTCVAVYTVVGIDLRLLEHVDMLRTELFREAFLLQHRADEWQKALVATGWRSVPVIVATP
jgi:hypothetical protein